MANKQQHTAAPKRGKARPRTRRPETTEASVTTMVIAKPTAQEARRGLQLAQVRFALYAMAEGGEMEKDCAYLLNSIVSALHDREPADVRLIRALRATADGAKRPDARFDRDLAMLVRCVRQAGLEGIDGAGRRFVALATALTKVPIFGGMSDADAITLADGLIRRLSENSRAAPTGVVADLVIAARERGVDLGHGATIGPTNSREQVVKLVNLATSRYGRTVSTIARGHLS